MAGMSTIRRWMLARLIVFLPAPTDVNHAMRNILKLGDAETKTVTKMVDDFLQWASSDTDDG